MTCPSIHPSYREINEWTTRIWKINWDFIIILFHFILFYAVQSTTPVRPSVESFVRLNSLLMKQTSSAQ